MKRKTAGIKITDEQRKMIAGKIADFYLNERDEEIGIIEQQVVTDFFIDEIAPVIYNIALDDAKKWYTKKQEDLEGEYYMLYKDERK